MGSPEDKDQKVDHRWSKTFVATAFDVFNNNILFPRGCEINKLRKTWNTFYDMNCRRGALAESLTNLYKNI